MTKFTEAIKFAAEAHDGQLRKGTNVPYIVHPLEVAAIVATLTDDVDVLCAAVLHDTVEDTVVSLDDVKAVFGERVAALVADESEDKRKGQDKRETWRIRKEENLEHLQTASGEALLICLGDKLSNIRAIYNDYSKIGDELWKRFNAGPEDIAWYYNAVKNILRERLDVSQALIDYEQLVMLTFSRYLGFY